MPPNPWMDGSIALKFTMKHWCTCDVAPKYLWCTKGGGELPPLRLAPACTSLHHQDCTPTRPNPQPRDGSSQPPPSKHTKRPSSCHKDRYTAAEESSPCAPSKFNPGSLPAFPFPVDTVTIRYPNSQGSSII